MPGTNLGLSRPEEATLQFGSTVLDTTWIQVNLSLNSTLIRHFGSLISSSLFCNIMFMK